MSKICLKCNKVFDNTSNFCNFCGVPLSVLTEEETSLLINDNNKTELLNDDDSKAYLHAEETEELYPENKANYIRPQTPIVSNVPYTGTLSEKDFYLRFASKKIKGWTTTIGIISLFTGAISILSLFFGIFSPIIFLIIDIAFYTIMGILILTIKKWYFPLLVTIYSGVFFLMSFVTNATTSGIAALIFGIFATIKLKKVNDAYKLYRISGILPREPIE